MYSNLMNKNVVLLVSTRTDNFLEYKGYLKEVTNETLVLENVSINYAMMDFQRNVFGGGINSYKHDLSTVIINKNYVISCHLEY